MHNTVLVLACLAFAGRVRSGQASKDVLQSSPLAERHHQPTTLQEVANSSTTFATFLFALNPVAAAFSPASPAKPIYVSPRPAALPVELCTRCSSTLSMVVAKDIFRAYSRQAPEVQRKILGLPVNITRFLPIPGCFTAALVLGFVYTPSSRVWVKAIGAWLASNIGFNTGKYLAKSRQLAALPAVAAVLAEDLAELPHETLKEISEKCGMTVDQLSLLSNDLYLIFFEACVKNMIFDTKELDELKKLQSILQMSGREVGTEVFRAAKHLPSKDLYSKFAFLAEKVLRLDSDKGGYEYEVRRIQKELILTPDEWQSLCEI